MGEKNARRKTYVRTGPAARQALKRVLAEFSVFDVYQEDLVAATWLWMATIPTDELREKVRPFISMAQADGLSSRADGDGKVEPDNSSVYTGPAKPAKKKRG